MSFFVFLRLLAVFECWEGIVAKAAFRWWEFVLGGWLIHDNE